MTCPECKGTGDIWKPGSQWRIVRAWWMFRGIAPTWMCWRCEGMGTIPDKQTGGSNG